MSFLCKTVILGGKVNEKKTAEWIARDTTAC